MHYTPRSIAFLCELLHPPGAPSPEVIQRVHNRLFQDGHPPYSSYAVTPTGAVLSNPVGQPGAVSSAAFLPDRFQFREELTGITLDEFIARMGRITSLVLEAHPVQLFTAQVVTVRSLVNPRKFRDSREYLKEGMLGFDSELASFGRDPELYGVRLVFPPTQSEPHAFTLRIESFANDPRSLFLENTGSFGPTVLAQGLDPCWARARTTYDFLVERGLPFLSHFDERQNA